MIEVCLTRPTHAEVAQLVEHAPEKRGVGSSILPLGTSLRSCFSRRLSAVLGAAQDGPEQVEGP